MESDLTCRLETLSEALHRAQLEEGSKRREKYENYVRLGEGRARQVLKETPLE